MAAADHNPSPAGRPTLSAVARILGVSATTVSNAYNRPDQLSPELRERILALAGELGYAGPHPVARSLRTGSTGVIGILFTETLSFALAEPTAMAFLEGVASVCEQNLGLGLLLMPQALGHAPEVIRNAAVDGFIVFSFPDDDARIAALLSRRLPTCFVDQPRTSGHDFVGIDDRAGAHAAARHLVELGHRRLGVLSFRITPDRRDGPAEADRQAQARYSVTSDRLLGYRDALAAAGIHWSEVLVEERYDYTVEAGRSAAAALLDRSPRPTALLAEGDLLAIGAIQAVLERGLTVPTDVSIVGFDDIPSAAQVAPALTTVHQPRVEKGRIAGEFLLGRLGRERGPRTVILPTRLIVRDSTGPPPVVR